MINTLSKNNSPLKILFITNKNTNKEQIKKLFEAAKIYFNISWNFLNAEEKDIKKIKTPDIMFIDFQDGYEKIFNWELYGTHHKIKQTYLQVLVLDKFDKSDFWAFKIGSDDVIYKDDDYEYLKWKIIAILRRMWDSHSKKTTIIYKGMIMDNIKKVFYFNDLKLHLTKKEFELMFLLMSNTGNNFITKKKIFELLWTDVGLDQTRVVDQIIFKIKKKLGKDIFEINKNGIKII